MLHVNDCSDDQVLFQAACKEAKVPIEWHVAQSAQQAISYLKSLVSLSTRHIVRWVDVILLDIVMPKENGLTVLNFVRVTPEIAMVPVVILTGTDSPALLQEAYALGANGVMKKPHSFDDSVKLAESLYARWWRAKRPSIGTAEDS